jgi:hypothetical protein
MAYIIGKSINTAGITQVIDHVTVKEPRFTKELNDAIKSLYPNETPEHKKLQEIITTQAQEGLKKFRSVHIAGKYFFVSKRNTKFTLKHIKS